MTYELILTFGAVSAALAAIIGLWKIGIIPFYRKILTPIGKFFTNLASVSDRVDLLTVQVSNMQKEFKPNGGTSFYDAVRRLESITYENTGLVKFIINNYKNIPVYQTDALGNVTFVNNAYCDLVGLKIEDLLGRGVLISIHPEDRDMVIREWARSVEGKSIYYNKFRVKLKNGEYRMVTSRADPIYTSSKTLIGFIGTWEFEE